jgi:predicted CopG family antitoxin
MKTINVTFEDDEFERLEIKKGSLSWHDYIMTLAGEQDKIEKIMMVAMQGRTSDERNKAIDILGTMGETAFSGLMEIVMKSPHVKERERALAYVDRVSGDRIKKAKP